MPTKRFLIAPLNAGWVNNVRPFLIPDDAFAELRNMYVFRGRLRKRFGSELMTDDDSPYGEDYAQLASRARVNLGNTDGAGDFTSATPCVTGGIFKLGQAFSVTYTVLGVDYTAMLTVIDDTAGAQAMLTTGTPTGTFDVSTGQVVITGAKAASAVYFYPAEPIMGIVQNESASINDEPTYVFDTRFAYQYSSGAWERIVGGDDTWSGDNSNFFWASSWRGTTANASVLFVTNFNWETSSRDPLKYYVSGTWTNYTPRFQGVTDLIYTARVVLPFKDRLVLLNVVEFTSGTTYTQYGNRCRFSQNGTPIDATNSFIDNVGGRGGYIDAPTQEQIISAEFLKDRLIVFFERSTWELVYTGNEILPFRWQKINTELGVESTFSVVPFDQIVMGIGNVGIHACSGTSVQRIDNQIPDFVFEITNKDGDTEGVTRVQGIRDYFVEHVYWTLPNQLEGYTYPNQVLVYDYKTANWALNDDSITAFGYFQNQQSVTWESSLETWEEAVFTWSSGTLIAQHRQVLGGNQEGYLFIIDPESPRNAPALQITNITGTDNETLTIVDHNLDVGDYIALENLNGITYPSVIVQVEEITDENTIIIDKVGTGTYTGGGTAARVSNPQVLTKQYNFFSDIGTNMTINKIDIMVDKTVNGEFSIQSYASSMRGEPLETLMIETKPYDITYYPLEQIQTRLWHSVYPNINGEVCQFNMTFSDAQIRETSIAWSDLEIHALMFYVGTTSSRFE